MPAPKGHPPYKGSEKGGRPKIWTDEAIEAEADAFDEWMDNKKGVWFKDFALERGYLPDKFTEFAEKNEKFKQVYRKAKFWQESLMVKGMSMKKMNMHQAGCAMVLSRVCHTDTNWKEEKDSKEKSMENLMFQWLEEKVFNGSKDVVKQENKQSADN